MISCKKWPQMLCHWCSNEKRNMKVGVACQLYISYPYICHLCLMRIPVLSKDSKGSLQLKTSYEVFVRSPTSIITWSMFIFSVRGVMEISHQLGIRLNYNIYIYIQVGCHPHLKSRFYEVELHINPLTKRLGKT